MEAVGMKYGVASTNFGSYADPHAVARIAAAAERAGWDGYFVWDHLAYVWNGPSGDPWILLAAAASATSRLRLGTAISPIPRYHPHLLAGTLVTLDALTGGRMILGAGIGGAPSEFAAFGGPEEARLRAEMTDEGLALIDALWRGEPVAHEGRFYESRSTRMLPRPVQQPRIPIWIGGNSAAARRRAARWDGWLADTANRTDMRMLPEELAARLALVRAARNSDLPFDVIVSGYSSDPADSDLAASFARVGATWYLESIHDVRGSYESMLARVEAGPPAAATG